MTHELQKIREIARMNADEAFDQLNCDGYLQNVIDTLHETKLFTFENQLIAIRIYLARYDELEKTSH